MRSFMDCTACGCLIDTGEAACPFCLATVRSGSAPTWLLVGLALGVGFAELSCGGKGDGGDGSDATTAAISDATTAAVSDPATVTAGDTSGATSSGSTDSGAQDTTTSDPTNDPTNADAVTYAGPDETSTAGPEPACDVWAQDCPEGQKCAPINDGIDGWSTTACVDVTGMNVPGEACKSEDIANSRDSCVAGAICWEVDMDGVGTCVALCEGSADAPSCPVDSLCAPYQKDVLNLCLPTCDPLLQDCVDPGDACYPLDDGFVCVVDASGDGGKVLDPCAFINVCDDGLVCREAAFVGMGCAPETSCCTPFCEFPDGACPGADQTCVQWFDPMTLPADDPKLAIGACGVPP